MVSSETWGEELLVPADTEIVLEGDVFPDQMVYDGPFRKWAGFAGLDGEANLMRVYTITRGCGVVYTLSTSFYI